MNIVVVILIGVIAGALPSLGVFSVEGHPVQLNLFVAAILRGVTVSLLTGLSLKKQNLWWHGSAFGASYGLLTSLTVVMAMDGSPDALYVVGFAPIIGAVAGLLIGKLAFRRSPRYYSVH